MMARMFVPTLFMAGLAIALLTLGYLRGQGEHLAGLKAGGAMTVQVLPLLAFAFIVAGMIQVLIPSAAVARWIGAESGARGIWIGALAGGLTPGGPYVSLPVVAGLLRAGAGVGTLVAFLTAWSLIAVARLPMEVGLLGWRFTVARLACTFFFPPIAGWLAHLLFRGFGGFGGAGAR
jgi:uncharacterized membrane protein YraQ (UPF0718 family)